MAAINMVLGKLKKKKKEEKLVCGVIDESERTWVLGLPELEERGIQKFNTDKTKKGLLSCVRRPDQTP